MDKSALLLIYGHKLPHLYIRFYAVGLVLFMLPFTRGLFIAIIPLSLLLVIGSLFYLHTGWNRPTILFFSFIFLSSFFLEMAGTATGRIFGAYHYERGLGPQLHATPLIIGLNWLFLVYACRSVALRLPSLPRFPLRSRRGGDRPARLHLRRWPRRLWLRRWLAPSLRILVAALVMVLYDVVLEWVAPAMQMWRFDAGYPPFRNFAAWFVAALVFQTLFERLPVHAPGRLAGTVLEIQLVFFVCIGLFSWLFIP